VPNELEARLAPLDTQEVDEFLQRLFGDVARRPQQILLREGAAVARYLKALAANLPAGNHRNRIDRLADLTWGTVFQVSPIEMAKTHEVVRFLRRHEQTYFARYNIDAATEDVISSPPPVPPQAMFRPPNLLSVGMSVQGEGTPQLEDDLSERIYAAYWALRLSGIENARGMVAVVLNEAGLTTRAGAGRAKHWEGKQVAERMKQFERKLTNDSKRPVTDSWRKRTRAQFAERWVGQFRWVQESLKSESSVGPDFRI